MKTIKLKEVLWLNQEKFPLTFSKEYSMIEAQKRPTSITVLGLLKEGKWDYHGVTLAFCRFKIKPLFSSEEVDKWIELRILIEKYGDYEANV